MARPRTFDREQALHKAMEVFWQYGYEATSTALLVDELGIARSSLYATFGSKDALYAEAMDCYLDDLRRRVIDELHREGAALEVLTDFFHDVAARGSSNREPVRCCMVVRASLSRPDQPAAIQERIDRAIHELDAAFLQLLQRARDGGTLPPHLELASSARFLTSTFQSLNLAAMVGRAPAERQDIVRRALASLQLSAPAGAKPSTPPSRNRKNYQDPPSSQDPQRNASAARGGIKPTNTQRPPALTGAAVNRKPRQTS